MGEDEDEAEGEEEAWVETETMHNACNHAHRTIVKQVRWGQGRVRVRALRARVRVGRAPVRVDV